MALLCSDTLGVVHTGFTLEHALDGSLLSAVMHLSVLYHDPVFSTLDYNGTLPLLNVQLHRKNNP